MKIGTILENTYTSKENPRHYSVVTGVNGKYVHDIYLNGNKIRKGCYYKSDVGEEKAIKPIGYMDITGIIRDNFIELLRGMGCR